MMLPTWETLQETWPLLAAIIGLVWRVESAMSKQRSQSEENAREIRKLETKVEAQASAAAGQAVQLGRIEEAIRGLGKTLDRMVEEHKSRGG